MAGFQKAKREQVWLKVLLSGASGCGKSYSALRLAKGIAEKCGSAIAYIGTEGSRNKYYADEFDYDLLELEEPFECEKYMDAIDEAVKAGYKVLVIDSMTHEWKWLNDVHDKMPGNSFTNWGKLKPRHHKFMDKVLNSPIHVIATARGKDDWVLEDKNGKQVPKKVGMGQQQDKDISYEYTVSLMIAQDTHVASADKDNTIRKEIIAMCNQLGGTKNAELMTTLKPYTANGNPNAIRDIDKAKECLAKIKNIKPVE